jgi:hypothetical protein
MPADLRNEGTFTGRLYSKVKDQCYGFFCRFGLNGMARSFKSLMGFKK